MLKKIIIISAMLTIGSQTKAFDEQKFSALDIFKIARALPSQVTSDQRCNFMMRFADKIESFPKESENMFIMGTLLAFKTKMPENAATYDPMIQKLESNEPGLKSMVEAQISSEYPSYKKA